MEHKENVTDINEFKRERLEKIFHSVTYQVDIFLEMSGITAAEIIWTETNDLREISFTIEEPDTHATLLTGEDMQQELVAYLIHQELPELKGYIYNPYAEPGFISFIKE